MLHIAPRDHFFAFGSQKGDFRALPGLAKTHQIFFIKTQKSFFLIGVMVFSSEFHEIPLFLQKSQMELRFKAKKGNTIYGFHKNDEFSWNSELKTITPIRENDFCIFMKKICCVFAKPGRAWKSPFRLPKAKKWSRGAIWTTFLKQKR